jgi:SSS family solute:Na+ symporter
LALQLGGGLRTGDPSDFVTLMLITTPLTTVIWVAVTLLTSPENVETLTRFYLRVRPHPMFWGPVARKASASARPESWGSDILGWLAVCGLIYGLLFGAGKVLLLEPLPGAVLLGVALTCAAFLAQTFHPRE